MTRQIRIAIDLDGVLTEHPAPLARAANSQFKTDLPDSAFVDSAGHNVTDDVRSWVYGVDGPAAQLEADPGAIEFLRSVCERFGQENVIILTARPESSSEMTRTWLARNGLDLCDVVFADDKVTAARKYGVTHAIEDSVRHARAYEEAGVETFLLLDGLDEPVAGTGRHVADLSTLWDELEKLLDAEVGGEVLHFKIVVSDVIDPVARASLEVGGDVIDVDGTDREALFAAVGDADALVIRSETQVDTELLEHAPNLRVVARAGVGVDNVDIDAATKAGVLVLNAPGANSVSAAEHTLAILLAIARQLTAANASMHAGKWERKRFKLFDIKDKTVGIVGLGRVGSVLAKRLKAFGAKVIAHDPYVSADRFRELGVERVSYPELLATSDIVSYHVPLTEETYHYLSREAIDQLRHGAVVINCARGDVVDHEALAEALDSGKIKAAGIDVFPEEPLKWSPLWGRDNVVLTPHIGGSSAEAQAAVGEIISSSVLASLRGEAVANAVNLPAADIEPALSRKLGLTAAAAGHLLSVLEPDTPSNFSMNAYGNVSDEVTELVFTTALAEGLQRWANQRATPVNARMIASAQEIGQHMSRFSLPGDPSVRFEFRVENEAHHQVTIHWNGDEIGIYEVDRFSLGQPLAGDVLITHHHDIPGIVGRIGSILGSHNVNIAGMQLGRLSRGGEAIMVLNVDDPITDDLLEDILAYPDVENAYVVSLPVLDS
ncbi:MAG: phosphoglycerate dehydrogenase [Chloroflexota bacterium]